MKIITTTMLLALGIFSSAAVSTAATKPQNTINHEAAQAAHPMANKIYTGTTPAGETCSVVLRSFYFDMWSNSDATYFAYVLFATKGQISSDVMKIQKSEELRKFMNDEKAKGIKIYSEQAGSCSEVCGTTYPSLKLTKRGQQLEFFERQAEPNNQPSYSKAVIELNSQRNAIKSVSFRAATWYIPVLYIYRTKTTFECNIK